MPYYVVCFISLFLSLFWLAHEFKLRKKRLKEPHSLKQLLRWGSRSQSPHPQSSALLFSALSFYFFAQWEALISYMFQRPHFLFFQVLGIVLISYSFLMRIEKDKKTKEAQLHAHELLSLLLGFCLLANAFFSLVFFPWLYFRSRFLRKPPQD